MMMLEWFIVDFYLLFIFFNKFILPYAWLVLFYVMWYVQSKGTKNRDSMVGI